MRPWQLHTPLRGFWDRFCIMWEIFGGAGPTVTTDGDMLILLLIATCTRLKTSACQRDNKSKYVVLSAFSVVRGRASVHVGVFSRGEVR